MTDETSSKNTITIKCLLCKEDVEINRNELVRISYDRSISIKVCDKCRRTWIKMRDIFLQYE